MSEQIDRIVNAATTAAKAEAQRQLQAALPSSLRSNPGEPDDDLEDDEDDGEEDDAEDPAEMCHLFIENDSAEDNLARAVAAYRAWCSGEHGIVIHRKHGFAILGPLDILDDEVSEWSEQNGVDYDGWRLHKDPGKILGLEYDQNHLSDCAALLCDEDAQDELAESIENYNDFNWNHRATNVTHVHIPGVSGPMFEIGQALKVDYRSDKDSKGPGTTKDFTHQHGEESGILPRVYALNADTVIIHGGNLHVAPEGIRD